MIDFSTKIDEFVRIDMIFKIFEKKSGLLLFRKSADFCFDFERFGGFFRISDFNHFRKPVENRQNRPKPSNRSKNNRNDQNRQKGPKPSKRYKSVTTVYNRQNGIQPSKRYTTVKTVQIRHNGPNSSKRCKKYSSDTTFHK